MNTAPFLLRRFFFRLSTVVYLAASGAAIAGGNAVVIGQSIDLSGPNAAIGRDYVAGIKTYFDALNASGGLNGKRVQLVMRDDFGRADGAVKAVTELIERDQIDYLFGGVGDVATQAILNAPVFKQSGHILFAPLASATQGKQQPVLFWRPSQKQEIQHIFAHFSKLGIQNVGVVLQNAEANQDAQRTLTNEIRERGMKLTATANIGSSGGGGDVIAAEAARLAQTKPGFVVVIADTIGTSLFLKEFRKHDAQTFVAGTSLINLSTLRELAGARAVEWTVFSQVVPNPNAGTSPIQMEHLSMMKKYRDETVSSLTLEGFAAAKSLAKTILLSKKGGRGAVHDLMAQNGDIDLGGLSIVSTAKSNHLSSYVDIALFKKGSGLMF
ncbi:MAG: ABC transporter substrate-binding protein [Herminiimonas sp.]|nr:ABC transporter substrate-binding protein [Herminiimonas sp.]